MVTTDKRVEHEVECLYWCLRTQGCTSLAYYRDYNRCHLYWHCGESTHENNADSFIEIACVAGTVCILIKLIKYKMFH